MLVETLGWKHHRDLTWNESTENQEHIAHHRTLCKCQGSYIYVTNVCMLFHYHNDDDHHHCCRHHPYNMSIWASKSDAVLMKVIIIITIMDRWKNGAKEAAPGERHVYNSAYNTQVDTLCKLLHYMRLFVVRRRRYSCSTGDCLTTKLQQSPDCVFVKPLRPHMYVRVCVCVCVSMCECTHTHTHIDSQR